MQDQELFEIFMKKKNDLDLCEQIELLLQRRIQSAIGKENANFYDVLRRLSNSINNTGWEDRHSAQIATINASMSEISAKHESFLP